MHDKNIRMCLCARSVLIGIIMESTSEVLDELYLWIYFYDDTDGKK